MTSTILYTLLVLSCGSGDGLICDKVEVRSDLTVVECAELARTIPARRLQQLRCMIQKPRATMSVRY